MKGTKKELTLLYDFVPQTIYTTADNIATIENEIAFHITNTGRSDLANLSNPDILTVDNTLPGIDSVNFRYNLSRFYIWFSWGTNTEDLATEDDSKNITCSPDQYNQSWYCKKFTDINLSIIPESIISGTKGLPDNRDIITRELLNNGYKRHCGLLLKKMETNGNQKLTLSSDVHKPQLLNLIANSSIGTYWILFPKKNAVLNAQESVGFILGKIVSKTKAGMTSMYIQSKGIEGYEDKCDVIKLDKLVPRPKIISFEASETYVFKGQKIQLSWKTFGGQYCSLEPYEDPLKHFESCDTCAVPVVQDTSYTLKCINGKDSDRKIIPVYVKPVVISSFNSSSSGPVNVGTPVTLSWKAAFSSSITIEPDIGPVEAAGQIVVTPKETTTYILKCDGLNPQTQSVTVEIINPFKSFSIDHQSIAFGECASISWEIITLEALTLACNQTGESWTINPKGTKEICIDDTTIVSKYNQLTYTITGKAPNNMTLSRSILVAVEQSKPGIGFLRVSGGVLLSVCFYTYNTNIHDLVLSLKTDNGSANMRFTPREPSVKNCYWDGEFLVLKENTKIIYTAGGKIVKTYKDINSLEFTVMILDGQKKMIASKTIPYKKR